MKHKEKVELPEYLRSYFWDMNFDLLNFKKSKTFILKRVLDRGDTKAVG